MEDPIQKPVPMSLYSTWEVERTAPNCIPRICSFKLQRIKLTKPLDPEVTSLTICASMSVGSFHRTLRTDEISLDKNGVLDTELDLFFSLQYPHFLKREQNVLNLSLQRRKRYRNRTIPGGYKTLAMGSLDMAQVMQCPFDDTLKLFAKGGGFQVAQIKLHQVTSLPHDNLRSHSGENSSTEEDDPELYFSEDELDSEGEERGRDKTKKHNKDNLRLKKRFNALLKKIKINDDALVEANDVLPPEEFSQTFSSLMAEISDDSGHSDSDSIGTLPKPALRPYFDADINPKADQNIGRYKDRRISPVEKGSSTDEGLVTKPSLVRVSTSPVPIKSTRSASQCSNSSAKVGEGGVRGEERVSEMRSPRTSPLCQKSPHTTQQNSSDSGDAGPSSFNTHFTRSRSTSLEESRFGREELSITEQFSSVIGSSDRIPSHMILCFDRDAPAHPIVRLMNNSHSNCIFLQSPSDPKVFLSSLVSKMQKYMNRHSSLPNISLTVIGDFASFSAILIPLTDVLSTKSVEWMKHFTFIFINTGEGPDHPICDYISSNDHCYCNMISAITQQEDITPLISYQQQATDTIQLCIGRVLVTQSIDEGGDQKDVQSDLPFLHSVQVVVKNKYMVPRVEDDKPCKVEEGHKNCTEHEVEFQVDFSTLPNKKENNVKQSLKGVFKNLGIYREFNGKEGQLYVKADYRKKENKGLQRLNKKSADLIPIHSNLSSNFLCMSKQLITVSVDGVELNDVSFFSVMPQWSSVVKTLPVSISPSGVLC